MNPNNCFPNHIYWINKSPRPFTTYIYTYYPTIHKSKYSHSTMSWSRNYRLPTQTKSSLAHFLPQGTPISLIPILIIIETISLFIQPMALAVRLTANITAGHLLIHLIGGATLVLINISPPTATITFIILLLLTILEFAVALIQAYVFTLLVSLYLHDNT